MRSVQHAALRCTPSPRTFSVLVSITLSLSSLVSAVPSVMPRFDCCPTPHTAVLALALPCIDCKYYTAHHRGHRLRRSAHTRRAHHGWTRRLSSSRPSPLAFMHAPGTRARPRPNTLMAILTRNAPRARGNRWLPCISFLLLLRKPLPCNDPCHPAMRCRGRHRPYPVSICCIVSASASLVRLVSETSGVRRRLHQGSVPTHPPPPPPSHHRPPRQAHTAQDEVVGASR